MSGGGDCACGDKVNCDLALLAPAFRKAVEDAIAECNAAPLGLGAMVYEAYRSQELQALYFARGRTVVPPTATVTNAATNLTSWHGYGLAVDVVHRTKFWKPPGGLGWFGQVAAVFRRHGCAWGGDWTHADPPHMQWGRCRPSPSAEAQRMIREDGVRAVWIALGAADAGDGPPAPGPMRAPPAPPVAVADARMLAWGRCVSPEFREKACAMAAGLGVAPSDLMACIAFDTAETFRADILNASGSGAVGLVQFLPATAAALGTSTTALAAMTPVAQLDWIAKYLEPWQGRLTGLCDLYMAILCPAAVGQPDETALFDRTDTLHPLRYRLNAALDADGDGIVTRAEACAKVLAKRAKGLREEHVWRM